MNFVRQLSEFGFIQSKSRLYLIKTIARFAYLIVFTYFT